MEVKGNFIVQGSYIDIHDNEVVNLSVDKAEVRVNGDNIKCADAEDLSKDDVISKNKRSKNNSGKSLIFRTEEEQRKWAEFFNEFLKKHKQFNEKGLTKDKVSYINRALAFFVDAWKKEGIYNTESYNNAPSGFLYYYCEIRGTEFKTHGNACQQIIRDCLGNKDDAILQAEVFEWVKKHL